MYDGSLDHDRVIDAFRRHVPGTYVRDYRDRGGFIVVCRGYRDLAWGDQLSTRKVYRQAPHVTLVNLPRGRITAPTIYSGLALHRPGWRQEFRRAMRHLSDAQMRNITRTLAVGEVFPGIIARG